MTQRSREFSSWLSDDAREHLDALLRAAESHSVASYQAAMRAIGRDLGAELRPKLPTSGDVLVVMTVEDADFLASGVVDAMALGDRTKVFCYWNERDAQRDVAPILSRYEEPLDEPAVSAVVVVKSIVSGACVVRTNLIEALDALRHDVPVFVVAPVMHRDAKKKLAREFPKSVAARFAYVTCAIDSDKDGDNVRPGIGGSVYELLGLGDKHAKNRVRPKLVAERSARLRPDGGRSNHA